jgi:hypothetical protein
MRSFAVICAHPPGFNAGMHSVDMAFRQVFARHAIAGEAHFYCLPAVRSAVEAKAALPIVYEDAYQRLSAIRDSDVVVYWGDFLHSRMYLQELRRRLTRKWPDKTQDEIISIQRAVLLLEGARSRPGTIIVFGGNLSPLDTVTLADEKYTRSLSELYRRSALVLMRDPFSAVAVNHVMSDFGNNHCGVDCAFLLDDTPSLSLYETRSRRSRLPLGVGVFVGRAPAQSYGTYLAFFQRICEQLGSTGTWLPWLYDRRPKVLEEYGGVFDVTTAPCGFEDTLSLLDGCDVVLTDTYHLCVNAWARGIPAICVGRGADAMSATTGDKKKELLYSMLGLGNLHVYAETLGSAEVERNAMDEIVESVCASVLSEVEMRRAFERIDGARISAERQLVDALRHDGLEAGPLAVTEV